MNGGLAKCLKRKKRTPEQTDVRLEGAPKCARNSAEQTEGGLRRFDARGAVVDLVECSGVSGRSESVVGEACAILRLVIRHGTPSVRPDDVLAALAAVADLAPPIPPRITRLAQGPLDEDARTVQDPLLPDRGESTVGS